MFHEMPNTSRHYRDRKESRRDRRNERRFRIAAKQSFLAGALALAFAFVASPQTVKADSLSALIEATRVPTVRILALPLNCYSAAHCSEIAGLFGCYPVGMFYECRRDVYRAQLARHSA